MKVRLQEEYLLQPCNKRHHLYLNSAVINRLSSWPINITLAYWTHLSQLWWCQQGLISLFLTIIKDLKVLHSQTKNSQMWEVWIIRRQAESLKTKCLSIRNHPNISKWPLHKSLTHLAGRTLTRLLRRLATSHSLTLPRRCLIHRET